MTVLRVRMGHRWMADVVDGASVLELASNEAGFSPVTAIEIHTPDGCVWCWTAED